ncbi:hypothetical protein J2S49_000842 [Arcanobacterium wilhelmae]|uniref:Antitoxin n=1 Tax=Arcanobacterium wilhelmae TaxID=1803177 RepID=A0ABT9NC22_9ACTO|nr:type II toxin-antitoxin system VapB family antitoxin [Arcanobacterium wilhelmae]MDP9800766.1 hypothetical protein [Arcanobacterium wilhelmae]
MTLEITDPRIDRSARQLAELTGESLTRAVGNAITEKLHRVEAQRRR